MLAYSAVGDQNAAASGAASGIVKVETPATTRRAYVFKWTVGPEGGAASDNTLSIRLKRQSTAGTWTSVTPSPLDDEDAVSLCVAGSNSTGAGTAGVILIEIGINARSTWTDVAVPGAEYVVPSTSAAGIIMEFGTISGGTDLMIGTMFWWE